MKKIICWILVAVMALSFAVPAFAASYIVSDPKWVAIDGKISSDEWGSPLYSGVTLQQAQEGKIDDTLSCWWFDSADNEEASFDLYLTHNDTALLIGCVIHNVEEQQTSFALTFSDYYKGTDVRRVEVKGKEYEAYTGYRIFVNAVGEPEAQVLTQGIDAGSLAVGSDYQALYDPENHSMTYEVAVPFVYADIDPLRTTDIALSAFISLSPYGNALSGKKDGVNGWLVGTGTAFCGGAENWAHKGRCIRVQLAPHETVLDNMPPSATPHASSASYHKDVDVEISSEPEYHLITADAPISTPLIIILVSVAVMILCAVVVTSVLVRDRNEKAAKAVAMAEAADRKEGEDA